MSTQFELAAQKLIYTALNDNISAEVFDAVPQLPNGMPHENFPYVVISEGDGYPFDTDDTLGAVVYCTAHIWSRAKGMTEAKIIAAEMYAILHRARLTLTGYSVLDILWESATMRTYGDGETRHGAIRYRLTIQEA